MRPWVLRNSFGGWPGRSGGRVVDFPRSIGDPEVGMDSRTRWGLVVGLCVAGGAVLAAVTSGEGHGVGRAWLAAMQPQTTASATVATAQAAGVAAASGREDASARDTYIIMFREPAVAAYRGGIAGIAAAPVKRSRATGTSRPDMRSPQAREYARYLQGRQAQIERGMAQAIGRQPLVSHRFQHAINGVVAQLGATEAERVRALPEILLVDEYR